MRKMMICDVGAREMHDYDPLRCPDSCRLEGYLFTEAELEAHERMVWEAAREEEMFNALDPDGQRAKDDAYLPPRMRTIGFATGRRQKYKTFDDWKKTQI